MVRAHTIMCTFKHPTLLYRALIVRFICGTILAVKKVDQLNIKTKIFGFEAHVLIGWVARVFASQPIRTRASKLSIFIFMLRWRTKVCVSVVVFISPLAHIFSFKRVKIEDFLLNAFKIW